MGVGRRLAWAVSLGCFLAGCAANPTVHDVLAQSRATLELIKVSPAPGASLTEGSIVEVELSYRTHGFRSGRFFVMPQVATSDPNRTTAGTFPESEYAALERATGRVRLRFPVRHVWRDALVKKPLVVWFYLNARATPPVSVVLAEVGPIAYSGQ